MIICNLILSIYSVMDEFVKKSLAFSPSETDFASFSKDKLEYHFVLTSRATKPVELQSYSLAVNLSPLCCKNTLKLRKVNIRTLILKWNWFGFGLNSWSECRLEVRFLFFEFIALNAQAGSSKESILDRTRPSFIPFQLASLLLDDWEERWALEIHGTFTSF